MSGPRDSTTCVSPLPCGGFQASVDAIAGLIHMHTVWTAGQVVGNFRKHNMAPPAFTFF